MPSVIDQQTFNEYTGNGVTTLFAYEFQLLAASDLVVTVGGAPIGPSDYTLTGVGNQAGGTVTFDTPPANGAQVLLAREMTLARETDYQEQGDLLADTVNNDFNRLWLALQEFASGGRGVPTALRVPIGETIAPLPNAAAREGYLLGFAGGGVVLVPGQAGSATSLALDLANTTDATKGAGLSGYGAAQPYAAGTAGFKLRERISVSDYRHLVFTATAKDLGDPASHVATSFESWSLAIQAALDEAYNRGGGTVVIDVGSGPFLHPTLLVDDYIEIKSNTTVIFEAEVKMGDYNLLGSVVHMTGDNITVHNPRIDGSGIYAGGSGYNGLSGGDCSNVKVYGGTIRNCARGSGPPADGGKGFQFEATYSNVVVDGTTIKDCFMAMSSAHNFTTTDPCGPLVFTGITAEDCEILLFVRQTNGRDTTGQEHTVVLDGFIARNCGTFEGLIQLSRAANVLVTDGEVTNATSIAALVRGNHAFCRFEDIDFAGDCTTLIDLDPSTYAPDSSYALENNHYDIKHRGTAGYVANASVGTPFRTLQDCRLKFQLQNDVVTKIVGDELRNGYLHITGQQGNKSFEASAAELFTWGLAKFANLATGHSVYAANVGQYSANAAGSPGVLTDASGDGLVFPAAYYDYERSGRRVTVCGRVTFPATASGAAAKIGGLPVAAANNAARINCGFSLAITDLGSIFTGRVLPGATAVDLYNASGVALTNANLSGKTFDFALTYFSA